jgi:pyruvate dehydrogenase E2 component (dihydrolipoamide acetyltransferase)
LRHRIEDLSYDALFVKILARALRVAPELNAAVDGGSIVLYQDIHVGFAVSVPGGILVPVVRHADKRPLSEIAAEVKEQSARARAGRLKPADMDAGTVSITNLGAHGIDAFTPILNPPQSAILGIGRIARRPVVLDDRIVPGTTCHLSLTFDHRVTDGVPAARLLEHVAQMMSDVPLDS